jgi:anti-sigma factor RsiW
MHAVVLNRLEEYLAGTLNPADHRAIKAHLNTCESCREEVQGISEISECFASLRADELVAPSPGFLAGIAQQLERRAIQPTFASLFSWRFAFGRRLAFASLLMLAILGSYLWVGESVYPAGPTPEAVMAQQNSPAFDSAPAEDNMLVTLTAYEH